MSQHSSTNATPGNLNPAFLFAVPHRPSEAGSSAALSSQVPLWLALHLPQLPLEAVNNPTENMPAVVFEQQGQIYRVTVANDAADQAGICPSMMLAAARAMVPQLSAFPRDRISEKQALEKLAARAMGWTPAVVVDEDCLLMEVAGSLKLYGGLQPLLASVHDWMQTETYCFRIAVTPTPASARLCARAGRSLCVTDRRQLVSHLRDLTVGWLTLDRSQRALLKRLGIDEIGDLLRLSRHDLARRLGPALIHQLDRLTGQRADPQSFYTPPPVFCEDATLTQETAEVELLLPAAQHLLKNLAVRLRHSCTTINCLNWALTDARERSIEIPVRLTHPRRDPGLFLKLSRLALETVQLTQPVTRLTLRARLLTSVSTENNALLSGDCDYSGDPVVLLDSLRNRLGHTAVQGIQLNPDHRPEKSWRYCTPGEHGPALRSPPRPLWLLRHPRHIKKLHDRPCLQGKPLTLGEQVERISSGWWDKNPVKRDYYLASNGQLQAWIFRDLVTGEWFLHGIF